MLLYVPAEAVVLAKALAVLALTVLAARIVQKGLSGVFQKTEFPEEIEQSIVRYSKYFVYFVGVLVMFSVAGVELSSVIVGIGAASIAISFATKEIIQNFVSGVLVYADRPFRAGDRIEIRGYQGRVKKIGIRSTTLVTDEGEVITIPNSFFVTNPVKRLPRKGRK